MKKKGLHLLLSVIGLFLLLIAGCKTEAQNKALIGGAVGAAAGQAIGRDTQGTLIGAGVGAGVGYIWGKSEDNKKERSAPQPNPEAPATGANTVTVQVLNSNGSVTPVVLNRNNDGTYTGPKGERYSSMPTQEQLKQAYGF